eukprot:m.150799 g.150799  ORF g.150799 m.150799 type:complete len:602 (+) comp16889_c0_seq3:270-2075(+)
MADLAHSLQLIHGEKDPHTDESVTLLQADADPKNGSLCITNYRLAFLVNKKVFIEVPLGCIERVEKLGGQSSRAENSYGLEIYCRDFRTLRFACKQETRARKPIFEQMQRFAFPISSGINFFAYDHSAKSESPGWNVYNIEKEMERQGLDKEAWVISDINAEYKLCPTYPSRIVVPVSMSKEELTAVAGFRSRGRIQALSYYHKDNTATITRCSQPRVGITNKRCAEDERMVRAIMEANKTNNKKIQLMDARPKRNAIANQAKGGGFESELNYDKAEIDFLKIENIHVMRESLKKVREICFPIVDDTHWFSQLDGTSWMKHAKIILSGACRVADLIKQGVSVIIHCSDGWDRTAQLSCLAMLMLDPYYRTIAGFEVLIEQEWLSFGHKFQQRLGLGDIRYADDERSPVFLQFIDCVWQIMHQHPCAFEFNESFLIDILDHMFSCRFGTFLYDCEQDRVNNDLRRKTISLWDYFATERKAHITNALYFPEKCDRFLHVSTKQFHLSFWNGYFLRWNHEVDAQEKPDERLKGLREMCDQLRDQSRQLSEQMQLDDGEGRSYQSSRTHSTNSMHAAAAAVAAGGAGAGDRGSAQGAAPHAETRA